MATVRDFDVSSLEHFRPHDEVKAVVRLIEWNEEKFIQIDTFGRSSREMPDKISQSLRLDETAFRKLTELGKKHF